jgi:nucleoside-diphosphate-sugar epimerase
MKLIVTGALGHIGSKLIRALSNKFKNPMIVMIDDLSTQRYSSLFNLPHKANYSFIEGKVGEMDWDVILESVNAVIHLAALTDAAGTADKPDLVHENNFESTKVIADACFKAGVPIIFPSSTSVYGSQSYLVDETCQELQPQSPYAACKIKEEGYLQDLFGKGLKGVICRLGTIYGVSAGMRFHTAVNKFCWQAVMKQPITVWETAIDQKRPYLSLDDCCQGICWIIEHNIFDGGIYNVVTDNFTVREVLEVIKKFTSTVNIQFVQHKIMNQLSYEVCPEKMIKTGFSFKGSLYRGIEDTICLLKNAYV